MAIGAVNASNVQNLATSSLAQANSRQEVSKQDNEQQEAISGQQDNEQQEGELGSLISVVA